MRQVAQRQRKAFDKENDRTMSIAEKIVYIHEPTDLQCGQAVLAMLTGNDVLEICRELSNDRETKLSEMRGYLSEHSISMSPKRLEAHNAGDLPEYCVLSLETPRCWHWSLYAKGTFYDPEHGVMNDFPECDRKYFWEVKNRS